MFICKLCGEEYKNEGDLGMHLMWFHELAKELKDENHACGSKWAYMV